MAPSGWTNASVLALAGRADPVETIASHARRALLEAVDAGWNPPPFDAFELAGWLRVPVEPTALQGDARTVPDDSAPGGVRIQYNPSRPRGRLQFSVAHEIAHTFFPDAAEAVRHRTATGAIEAFSLEDDWQLELLCNIAAGELLMPFETIEDLDPKGGQLDIERLMQRRRELNVSTEALLRRVVSVTEEPVAMFAARPSPTPAEGPLIDYAEPSRTSPIRIPRGLRLPALSLVADCTGLGFTAVGVENWGGRVGSGLVQAVGIPPYPGQRLPRIAGIFASTLPSEIREPPRLIEVFGDLLKTRGSAAQNLILLLVNNRSHGWGGKLGHRMAARYRRHAETFRYWTLMPGSLELGNVHVAHGAVGDPIIVSLVAQDGVADPSGPEADRLRYPALLRCLEQVADIAAKENRAVHSTRIGTGEARGKWPLVRDMLDRVLVAKGIAVTVYRQPGGDA